MASRVIAQAIVSKNPKSNSYSKPKNPQTDQQSKKRKFNGGGKKLPYEEWKKQKEYE